MNVPEPAQIALILLVALIIVVSALIIWRRITTKEHRERLKAAWDSEPKVYAPPSNEPPSDKILNSLQTDPKHCPFCRGDIEPGVLKCKHCGEWLDPNRRKEQEVVKTAQLETAKSSKSTNQAIGWVVFILFGLPALYALFRGC